MEVVALVSLFWVIVIHLKLHSVTKRLETVEVLTRNLCIANLEATRPHPASKENNT